MYLEHGVVGPLPRRGPADLDGAAGELEAVHGLERHGRRLRGGEVHEAEALGAARDGVVRHDDLADGAEGREDLADVLLCRLGVCVGGVIG